MLQAVATADTEQQVRNKKVHLLSFLQRVNTIVNAMRFSWRADRLRGSSGKSPCCQAMHSWRLLAAASSKCKRTSTGDSYIHCKSLKTPPLKKYNCISLRNVTCLTYSSFHICPRFYRSFIHTAAESSQRFCGKVCRSYWGPLHCPVKGHSRAAWF